jgi:hypothetical protein
METGKTESQEHILKCAMVVVFIFKNEAMKKYYCETGNKSLIAVNLVTRRKTVAIFRLRL